MLAHVFCDTAHALGCCRDRLYEAARDDRDTNGVQRLLFRRLPRNSLGKDQIRMPDSREPPNSLHVGNVFV